MFLHEWGQKIGGLHRSKFDIQKKKIKGCESARDQRTCNMGSHASRKWFIFRHSSCRILFSYDDCYSILRLTQLAGAVEYTVYFSAAG